MLPNDKAFRTCGVWVVALGLALEGASTTAWGQEVGAIDVDLGGASGVSEDGNSIDKHGQPTNPPPQNGSAGNGPEPPVPPGTITR
jgi:hypothetical protein